MAVKYSIQKGEKFTCLFSGGKDSCLALSIACDTGIPVSNIVIDDTLSGRSLHHGQERRLMEAYAEVMKIPNYYISEDGDLQLYYHRLARCLRSFSQQGINSLVMGFIYDDKAAKNHTRICEAVGMDLCLPLWGMSDEQLLYELDKREIRCIITSVDREYLSDKWLGRIYDRDAYDELKSVGINPFGEAGEFHTTVIKADIFSKKKNI